MPDYFELAQQVIDSSQGKTIGGTGNPFQDMLNRLSPAEQRKQTTRLYQDYRKAYKAEVKRYQDLTANARRFNIDPSFVVTGTAPRDLLKEAPNNPFFNSGVVRGPRYTWAVPGIENPFTRQASRPVRNELTEYGENLALQAKNIDSRAEYNAKIKARNNSLGSLVPTQRGRRGIGPGSSRAGGNPIRDAIARGAGLTQNTIATSTAGIDEDSDTLGGTRVGKALRGRLRGFSERNLGAA